MKEPERKLILVVSLWLKNENVSDFEDYERRAARLLARHDGKIERAVRIKKQASKTDEPFEIHVIEFPNEQSFTNYLADPERQELAARRDEIIARTETIFGYDAELYQ